MEGKESLVGECHIAINVMGKKLGSLGFFLIAVLTIKSFYNRKECFRTDAQIYDQNTGLKKDLVSLVALKTVLTHIA